MSKPARKGRKAKGRGLEFVLFARAPLWMKRELQRVLEERRLREPKASEADLVREAVAARFPDFNPATNPHLQDALWCSLCVPASKLVEGKCAVHDSEHWNEHLRSGEAYFEKERPRR